MPQQRITLRVMHHLGRVNATLVPHLAQVLLDKGRGGTRRLWTRWGLYGSARHSKDRTTIVRLEEILTTKVTKLILMRTSFFVPFNCEPLLFKPVIDLCGRYRHLLVRLECLALV